MQSEIVATLATSDGYQFSLLEDGNWDFGDNPPELIREGVELVFPSLYIDTILQDRTPYIKAVAEMVGAKVVYVRPPIVPPPDAVF
jgi:hypothetical protein